MKAEDPNATGIRSDENLNYFVVFFAVGRMIITQALVLFPCPSFQSRQVWLPAAQRAGGRRQTQLSS